MPFRTIPDTVWATMTREAALAFVQEQAAQEGIDLRRVLDRLAAGLDASHMEVLLNDLLPDEWTPHALPYVCVFKTQEPFAEASVDDYVPLFRKAGFISDDDDCPTPVEPLRVSRGVTQDVPEAVHGMSWTTDLATAIRFAHRHDHWTTEEAKALGSVVEVSPAVYSATIPPAGILARFYEQDEDEVLVDPFMLQNVRRYEGAMPF